MKVTWPWKNDTVTRTDLLALARIRLEAAEEEYRQEKAHSQEGLEEWRENVKNAMLAMIPLLENGTYSWNPEHFRRPQSNPSTWTLDRLRSAVIVLEHLDTEIIPPELRKAIGDVTGAGLSYD